MCPTSLLSLHLMHPQIAERYEQVAPTESYQALPRYLVDAVAAHCAARSARLLGLLQQLATPATPLPRPSYG